MATKTFKFPSAFSVLFIIMILAVVLTWLIPAGSYDKLSYNEKTETFLIHQYNQPDQPLPATQQTLKDLNINIELSSFTEGKIRKAIAIPNSYHRVEQNPQSLLDIPQNMVIGTIEGADIMVFIFVLGGLIGVINKTGAFAAGLSALTKRTQGKEFSIIFMVSVLMAVGGTLCGIEEEAVAFYPILAPVFIALGYDAIITVGAIFLAASMGTAFSMINPFSVVIASNAAGIPFTDGIQFRLIGFLLGSSAVIYYLYRYAKKIKANPENSLVWEERHQFLATYSNTSTDIPPFNLRRKIILALFCIGFPIMIWGVMVGGWWFPTMAASFLTITIIVMFISGLKEDEIVNSFTHGASELVGVSLIIGLARGVNIILEQGMVSDTILASLSDFVATLPASVFIIGQLFVFIILGLFVPSSSGLAVLSMPIMAPLADTVGIPRDMVVSAYNWGQYAMLFLAPTGLVLVTCQMLHLPFNKWIRFVLPMIGVLLVIAITLLLIQLQMVS